MRPWMIEPHGIGSDRALAKHTADNVDMATRMLIIAEASLGEDTNWNIVKANKHPLSEAENELSAATTCPPTPSGLDGEDDTRGCPKAARYLASFYPSYFFW